MTTFNESALYTRRSEAKSNQSRSVVRTRGSSNPVAGVVTGSKGTQVRMRFYKYTVKS